MKTYTMICDNGWIKVITAKNLRGAKMQATKKATHDCGSFRLMARNITICERQQWHGFNTWGWYPWTDC